MNIDHEMWTHGSNLVVQDKSSIDAVTCYGDSALITGKLGTTMAWFHLPIPTPVLIRRSKLLVKSVKIMVKGSPSSAVRIDAIHLWDGNNKKAWWDIKDNLFAFGNVHEFPIVGNVEVNNGLNLSLGVIFLEHGSPEFELIGAGCEFSKPSLMELIAKFFRT